MNSELSISSSAVIDNALSRSASTGVQVVTASIEQGGSRVIEGESVARRYTHGEKLPTLTEAVTHARSVLAARNSQDFKGVPVAALRMRPTDGGLYNSAKSRGTGETFGYTHDGLLHLISYMNAPRNFTAALEYLSPKARAEAFNDIVEKAEREAVTLRTAMLNGRRVVRAAVSTKHSLETGDDQLLLDTLVERLPGDAKARIVIGWNHTFAEAIIPSMARELKRGDAVFAKVLARNSEVKRDSLEVEGGTFRLTCLNGMTSMVEGSVMSVRHIGDLSTRIRRTVDTATLGFDIFVEQFRRSYSTVLPAARAEVVGRVIKAKELPENVGTQAIALWDADGAMSAGDTLGGLVNAMTRASQNYDFETASVIERAAGELLNADGLKLLGL